MTLTSGIGKHHEGSFDLYSTWNVRKNVTFNSTAANKKTACVHTDFARQYAKHLEELDTVELLELSRH